MAGSNFHPDRDDAVLEYEYDGAAASTALVEAICALENVDPMDAPTELDDRLYDHVDPRALDSLVETAPADERVEVRFTLEDYRVRISDDERIVIRDRGP